MSKTHKLKTWPEYFAAVMDGSKNFEIRQNDRDFQVGDTLILQEYDPQEGEYTGHETKREVIYMVGEPWVPAPTVVMGLVAPADAAADGVE